MIELSSFLSQEVSNDIKAMVVKDVNSVVMINGLLLSLFSYYFNINYTLIYPYNLFITGFPAIEVGK